MTKVSVKHGTEGPHYDPYGYTEVVVEIRGITYEFHSGLAVKLEVCGTRFEEWEYEDLALLFKELTGFFPHEWEEFYYKAQSRKRSKCRSCGSRKLRETRGYPGEVLLVCDDCNEIVDCEVTNSGII